MARAGVEEARGHVAGESPETSGTLDGIRLDRIEVGPWFQRRVEEAAVAIIDGTEYEIAPAPGPVGFGRIASEAGPEVIGDAPRCRCGSSGEVRRSKAERRHEEHKRYYAKTAFKYERRRWTEAEDKLVLGHEVPDSELSPVIRRSLKAISNRRWRLMRKGGSVAVDVGA